LLLFAVSVTMA